MSFTLSSFPLFSSSCQCSSLRKAPWMTWPCIAMSAMAFQEQAPNNPANFACLLSIQTHSPTCAQTTDPWLSSPDYLLHCDNLDTMFMERLRVVGGTMAKRSRTGRHNGSWFTAVLVDVLKYIRLPYHIDYHTRWNTVTCNGPGRGGTPLIPYSQCLTTHVLVHLR